MASWLETLNKESDPLNSSSGKWAHLLIMPICWLSPPHAGSPQQWLSLLSTWKGVHLEREGTYGNFISPCLSPADQCRPAPECGWDASGPLAVDVDVAFVVDSSHGVDASFYRAALTLVDAVLDDVEVAVQPGATPHGARVALVTYTTLGFWPGARQPPVREGFHLTSYGHRTQMQRRVHEAAGHPLQGAPALGYALEWTLERVLLTAQLPGRAQVLLAIVASKTSSWDQEKLRTLSLEAKCKGVILFVLALGPGLGTRELEELARVASAPSEQHLLHLEGISDQEMAYARGFTRAFLNLLKSEQSQSPGGRVRVECGERGQVQSLHLGKWSGCPSHLHSC